VTRNCKRNGIGSAGIGSAGIGNGANRIRFADAARECRIRHSAARWNRTQRIPDPPLERRAVTVEFEIEARRRVLGELEDFLQVALQLSVVRHLKVYPADVRMIWPVAKRGRPRKRSVPDILSIPAEDMLAHAKWQTISWRTGTKGKLTARFAARRVRVAE
jgi:hypothetical protein